MNNETAFLGVEGMSKGNDLKFREKRCSGGFTIVEVCVAVAIIAVLLSVGFVALIKHQRELKVQEMDNLARAAYMAAEGRALDLARAGTLVKAVGDSDGKLLYGVTYTDKDRRRHEYDANQAVGSMEGLDSDILTAHVLAYVQMSRAIEEGVLIKPESVESKVSGGEVYLIYDLFSGSAIDAYYAEEKITDSNSSWLKLASIIDGLTATSSIGDILRAGCSINSESGIVELKPLPLKASEDRASARAFVGRYDGGVSAVRNAAPGTAGNVEVTIYNGENLFVEIKYPENSHLDIKISYKTPYQKGAMKLSDEDLVKSVGIDGMITGQFLLDGDPSSPDRFISATRFGHGRNSDGSGWWKNGDNTVTFAEYINGMFTVEVKAVRDGYRDGETVVKQGQPLFADGSTNDKAIIENLRHLQNLDTETSGAAGVISIIQKADIDAKGGLRSEDGDIVASNDGYRFKSIYNSEAKSYISKENGAGHYIIKDLNISGTHILGSTPYSGLFGIVKDGFSFTGVTVHGLKSTVQVGNGIAIAGGLAGGSVIATTDGEDGTATYTGGNVFFSDCVISNAKISSESKRTNAGADGRAIAGGMIGFAGKVYFKSCYIGNDMPVTGVDGLVTVNSKATADGASDNDKDLAFAGGMVGSVTDSVKAENCRLVKANVTSEGDRAISGGLAGYLPAGAEFSNCTVGNYEKSPGDTVAGDVQITSISNSDKPYHASDIYANNSSNVWKNGAPKLGAAGGMIGYVVGGAKFQSCKAEGNISITGTNVSDQAGGLIGLCVDKAELIDCDIRKKEGQDSLTVTAGAGNAGGIVGYAAGGSGADLFSMSECDAESVAVKNETASERACVGGLIGYAENAAFSKCNAINVRVEASGASAYAGGMAGFATKTKLSECQVYWDRNKPSFISFEENGVLPQITGYNAGGMAGWLAGGLDAEPTISKSFAATFVKGYYSGGLIGYASGDSNINITLSYADNVIGGSVEGGLIGYSECNSITMSHAYAVTEAAKWSKFDEAAADSYIGGFFGNKGEDKILAVNNAYASFYGNILDKNIYSGGNANYAYCFRISGGKGYTDKPNGMLMAAPAEPAPADPTPAEPAPTEAGKDMAAVLTDLGGNFALKSEADTHPYLLSGSYPYPGLTGLPHYGDWGNNNSEIDIRGPLVFRRGGATVEARVLKSKNDAIAPDALVALNVVLQNCTFEDNEGKSYKFISATHSTKQPSFAKYGDATDYSRVSLSFTAERDDGAGSKEVVLVNLICEPSVAGGEKGGLRTEASMEMAKAMLTGTTFGQLDNNKDNAWEKVKEKLDTNNITSPEGWNDYKDIFTIDKTSDSSLGVSASDASKWEFAFTLKKTGHMKTGTERIIVTLQKDAYNTIGAMLGKTDWDLKANITEIARVREKDGNQDIYRYKDKYSDSANPSSGPTPGDLADKATAWLAERGFGSYQVRAKSDTKFRTQASDTLPASENDKYAEAEFELFQKVTKDGKETWEPYNYYSTGNAVILRTARTAAPNVVLDYLQALGTEAWKLTDGSNVYVYADSSGTLTAAADDKKDFANAVKKVMDDLDDDRGLGGYTLTPNQDSLQIKEDASADPPTTKRAFMTFKVKKGESEAERELKAEIFLLEGFALDAPKLLNANTAYGNTLSLTNTNTQPLVDRFSGIAQWAAAKLARVGYRNAAAKVAGITLTGSAANGSVQADVTMALTYTDAAATAHTANVTVKSSAGHFVAVTVQNADFVNKLKAVSISKPADFAAAKQNIINQITTTLGTDLTNSKVKVKDVGEAVGGSHYNVIFESDTLTYSAGTNNAAFTVSGLDKLEYTVANIPYAATPTP